MYSFHKSIYEHRETNMLVFSGKKRFFYLFIIFYVLFNQQQTKFNKKAGERQPTCSYFYFLAKNGSTTRFIGIAIYEHCETIRGSIYEQCENIGQNHEKLYEHCDFLVQHVRISTSILVHIYR